MIISVSNNVHKISQYLIYLIKGVFHVIRNAILVQKFKRTAQVAAEFIFSLMDSVFRNVLPLFCSEMDNA